ncbi:MAG: hypothetical protein JNN15_08570 [Blastocatellia bacterium]|nr:hypothetical protein [Blastocatellia bacterium]
MLTNTFSPALWLIEQEALALLTRLARLQPFALHMPMVAAATVSLAAQQAIEQHMLGARQKLQSMVVEFIDWLQDAAEKEVAAAEAQSRFTFVRLRFNSLISQFDIFADVLAQRSEHETGVWIAGLDYVATDALRLPNNYYQIPPIACYLDRGHGAAIRRIKTRLPGGDQNPVAIIRVPRERMVGSGISSSLVHEVGHQASALLNLINSLRPVLRQQQKEDPQSKMAWQLLERWISEIIADFWSVAKVGIAAPLGLMAVVSLPRPFVFRISLDDPHPVPWIRVKLSCGMGNALYPHPQWQRLASLWEQLYPTDNLEKEKQHVLKLLEATIPRFAALLVKHRPKSLQGRSLQEVLAEKERHPSYLSAYYQKWKGSLQQMQSAAPTFVFATVGQARMDGEISPEQEGQILSKLLTYWATYSSLSNSAACAEALSPLHPLQKTFQPTLLNQGGLYV